MDSKLLTIAGLLGPFGAQRKVKFTLDTAATATFISKGLASKFGTPKKIPMKKTTVLLPSGQTLESHEALLLPMKMRNYSQDLAVRVLDMTGYDVILGLDWLINSKATIDFLRGVLHIPLHGAVHKIKCSSKIYDLDPLHDSSPGNPLELFTLMDDIEEETLCAIVRDNADDDMPTSHHPALQALLDRYSDRFKSELPPELPKRAHVEHIIDTGDAKPVNTMYYRLTPEQIQEQKRQITLLLEKGLIRPSSSPWGSPVLFVPKPGGKWRMCVDYRALNKVTLKNKYPLPRIEDCLDAFKGAKIFSKIDLTSGFWQILVRSMDIPKTAFNTRNGKYEFLVMPFGLCNAPATFQSFMNEILRDMIGEFIQVYLDDIVVYSKTVEEHEKHLDKLFQVLQREDLFASPGKTFIGRSEIEFCGHHISQGPSGLTQIKPLTSKVDIIKTWPAPTTVHHVRQFLGITGFYRRYIQGYAKIAVPLQELLKESNAVLRTKKHRPITWTARCALAFNQLKDALASDPVLIIPDTTKPFLIETDASEWAVGAVLYQFDQEEKCHPVAFGGKKLHGAELNYPVHEKELYAIKLALKDWEHWIQNGQPITVLTDHQSLQYMNSMTTQSKRLARWVEEFQSFHLDIKYRPGSQAIVPDALSRRPDFMSTKKANMAEDPVTLAAMMSEDWRGFLEHEVMNALHQHLKSGRLSANPQLSKLIISHKHQYKLDKQHRLLRILPNGGGTAPYLDPLVRRDFAMSMHKNYGHFGFPGILGVLKNRAWWPTMKKDLQNFLQDCPECQLTSKQKPKTLQEPQFHQINPNLRPFDKWAIDMVGPLPETPNGNKWIVTAIDYATGWPVAKALPSKATTHIAKFIHEEIFSHYGFPDELLSDNGMEFLGEIVEHLLAQLKTTHRLTTPYHPRTNGKVERYNGILGNVLTKMCLGSNIHDWDSYLPQAVFSTRIRQHRSTEQSPYFLVYGQHPKLPHEWENMPQQDHDARISNLKHARQAAHQKLLDQAAKAGLVSPEKFVEDPQRIAIHEGDFVLIRNENRSKLEPKWYGPLQVLRRHWLGTYVLQTPDKRVLKHLVHGNRLVKAQAASLQQFWAWTEKSNGIDSAEIQDARATDQQVLDSLGWAHGQVPSWNDLSSWSDKKWRQLHVNHVLKSGKFERPGGRSFLVGEDQDKDSALAPTNGDAEGNVSPLENVRNLEVPIPPPTEPVAHSVPAQNVHENRPVDVEQHNVQETGHEGPESPTVVGQTGEEDFEDHMDLDAPLEMGAQSPSLPHGNLDSEAIERAQGDPMDVIDPAFEQFEAVELPPEPQRTTGSMNLRSRPPKSWKLRS